MKYVSKQKFHAVLKLKKDTFALDINRENFQTKPWLGNSKLHVLQFIH